MRIDVKIIVFLALSCSGDLFSQKEKIFDTHIQYEKGDTIFAFNNCKLKVLPTMGSKTLDTLSYGDLLIVDSNYVDYNSSSIGHMPFLKVKHNAKAGYIKQGDISICKMALPSTNDFFLANHLLNGDTMNSIKLKFVAKGIERTNYTQELKGLAFSLRLDDNKGLDSINNIISIEYYAEACGVEGGITYLIWHNSQLKELVTLSSMSEAGLFYMEESLIFPADSGGRKNKIIYRVERGESVEESTNWWKTTKEEREHSWTNNQVQPAFWSKPTKE